MLTVFDLIYHQPEATMMTSTTKQLPVVKEAHRLGLVQRILRPVAATPAQVALVHDPKFVQAVIDGKPEELAESQGFNWSPGYSKSLFTIFGGQMAACRLAVKDRGLVFHPASGAHHAVRGSGSAFCTFNFLVGGPMLLLRQKLIERVLIIDLDEHQGNGTHSLVKNDPRFAQFDISGCNFGVGELDTSRAYFKIVPSKTQYFHALERLGKMIEAFDPQLVEYQAGMDCADDDGGPRGMDEEALRLRDRYVFEEVVVKRGLPCVFNLAGGYLSDGRTVKFHVNTVKEAIAAEEREYEARRPA